MVGERCEEGGLRTVEVGIGVGVWRGDEGKLSWRVIPPNIYVKPTIIYILVVSLEG